MSIRHTAAFAQAAPTPQQTQTERGRWTGSTVTDTGRRAFTKFDERGFFIFAPSTGEVDLQARIVLGESDRPTLTRTVSLAARVDFGLTDRGTVSAFTDLVARVVLGADVAGGLNVTHTLAARLDAGITDRAAMTRTVDLAATIDFGIIDRATLTSLSELVARIVLGIETSGTVDVEKTLAAKLELGSEIRPRLAPVSTLEARIVLGAGIHDALTETANLVARILLGATARPTIQQENRIATTIDLGFHLDDSYTGPGSGLVVSGITPAQFMAALREGDYFRATLPFAGITGRHGMVRVLSRSVDNDGRLTFTLQFIPHTDASIMRAQEATGRPRLTLPKRSNMPRRLSEAEERLAKLEGNG